MLLLCPMKRDQFGAHMALLGVALIYGANYTIAKEILDGDYMHPMALVLFRIVSALVLFLVVHGLFVREKVDRKDLILLAICSIFGVVINQSFFITGLKYTTPINASVLMITTPLLVLILSILRKQEELTNRKILGVLIGAGATLVLILGKGEIDFSGTLKGDVLVLINAMSYALYLVLIKPLMQKYNPLTIVKWIFIFSIIPVLPFSYDKISVINWDSFTPLIWMAFIYVMLFVTFFSYLLNAKALKRVKPSIVGIYIYLQPFIATLVALSLGRDQLTPLKLFCGLFIILGVYLVSTKSNLPNWGKLLRRRASKN